MFLRFVSTPFQSIVALAFFEGKLILYFILSLQSNGYLRKPQSCCDLRPIQIEESFPQDSSPPRQRA